MTEVFPKIFKLNSSEIPLIFPLAQEFRKSIGMGFSAVALHEKLGILMDQGMGYAFCTKKDDVIRGMIVFQITKDLCSDEVFASEIAWWIRPEFRGGSDAVRLLNAYESFSTDQGADYLSMVHLEGDNGDQLKRIYEKRGYRPLETQYIKKG